MGIGFGAVESLVYSVQGHRNPVLPIFASLLSLTEIVGGLLVIKQGEPESHGILIH